MHEHADPGDQEVVALLAAAFAYGRVELLNRAVKAVVSALGPSPRAALLQGVHQSPTFLPDFRYRFNDRSDVVGLCEAIARTLQEEESLGASFARHRASAGSFERALEDWVRALRARASCGRPARRGLKFLLPDPAAGGPCKRWRLFLRWMIRPDDGLDLGLWSGQLSPAELLLPLDAHWTRIGPRLGWTQRRTPGRAMAEDLTRALRRLCPEDPLRYDFAICHLGMTGACPPRLEQRHCLACPLRGICATGARATRQGRSREHRST